MADLNQQQVIEYIKGISVLELSQLVKTLEAELGVSAAAAMPMAMPMGGAAAGAAAPVEEKTDVTVTLTEIVGKKIDVIKVVGEVTSLGLNEAKHLVESHRMYSLPKNIYRERIDFSKIKTTVPIPNLIEIQKKSYERFLQMNRLPSEREDAGLQSVFKSVFPISDFRENSSLEFIEY